MQGVTKSTSPPAGLGLLAELVSEPRLSRVLTKVADHAREGLGGAEVALLLDGPDGPACEAPCRLAAPVQRALERWSSSETGVLEAPMLLTGAGAAAALAHPDAANVSLCAAPVRHGERRLGTLVAVSDGARSLGPAELSALEAYAVQAAIAVTNARLFEAQEALAKHDPLTGLLNHREFHETIARELSRSRRDGTQLSVLLLDLDRFKAINDAAGHGAGDRVLRAVASALSGVCRSDDQTFRVGGDEFALVLPRTALEAAGAAASRAAGAVEALSPRVEISYGVGSWPEHGPTKDAMLARADAALYEMKSRRRGRVAARAIRLSPGTRSGRQRERLAVASRLSTKLAHAQDPPEVARLCVDELHQAFEYYLAVIQRLDPDGVLRVVAGAGPLAKDTSDFLARTQSVTEGVNGRVARTGEPALVPDTRLDPDYLHVDPGRDPGSELAVPVRVQGRIWGVLNLEQVAVHAFADDDLLLADSAAAQAGSALHRCELVQELEHAFLTTLGVLSDAVEFTDAYTARHANEVCELVTAVARRLGVAGKELRAVRHGALMHDLGKVGVRSEILLKPGALDEQEREEMKQHTVIGARMLERIPFFADVVSLVRSSHERWDGNGYPDSLRGRSIPLGARVIAACDAFHAMTSDRPYRPAMSRRLAILEMRACAGTQFDPEVVTALLEEVDGRA